MTMTMTSRVGGGNDDDDDDAIGGSGGVGSSGGSRGDDNNDVLPVLALKTFDVGVTTTTTMSVFNYACFAIHLMCPSSFSLSG